jgi:aldehyde:ferredoxin oxidoreductase
MIPEAGLPLPYYENTSPDGRGEVHKITCNHYHVMNSAGLCFFMYLCMNADHVHDFLNLVTGTDFNMDEVLKAGERINNIRQAFNIKEGLTVKDFKLPPRIIGNPPLPDGPTAGNQVDSKTMAHDYFQAMDWDIDTGKPSKAKLLELGLDDVAEAIWT